RHRSAREFVDVDAAMFVNLDAQAFHAESHDVGPPADGEHHFVGGHRAAAGQSRHVFVARFLDGGHGVSAGHGDAALAHLIAQMFAHVVVEAAQDVLAAIDQSHFAAEPSEDAGKLDRDIAAALNDDAPG